MNDLLPSNILLVAEGLGIGTGRGWANAAALLGLVSVIVAGLALARSMRIGATAALVVGLAGSILSGLHLAYSAGAVGTGNGRLGAIVALVLGLMGMSLGAIALTRVMRVRSS